MLFTRVNSCYDMDWGGPVAQWLRAPPADKEFLGSNPTAIALSGLPHHEMTSAVNVIKQTLKLKLLSYG